MSRTYSAGGKTQHLLAYVSEREGVTFDDFARELGLERGSKLWRNYLSSWQAVIADRLIWRSHGLWRISDRGRLALSQMRAGVDFTTEPALQREEAA